MADQAMFRPAKWRTERQAWYRIQVSLEGLCQPRGLRHHARALTQYQAQAVLHKSDLQTSKRAWQVYTRCKVMFLRTNIPFHQKVAVSQSEAPRAGLLAMISLVKTTLRTFHGYQSETAPSRLVCKVAKRRMHQRAGPMVPKLPAKSEVLGRQLLLAKSGDHFNPHPQNTHGCLLLMDHWLTSIRKSSCGVEAYYWFISRRRQICHNSFLFSSPPPPPPPQHHHHQPNYPVLNSIRLWMVMRGLMTSCKHHKSEHICDLLIDTMLCDAWL